MLRLTHVVHAHRRARQFGQPNRKIFVGSRPVDVPSVPVAVGGGAEYNSTELKPAVEVVGRRKCQTTAKRRPSAIPSKLRRAHRCTDRNTDGNESEKR